MSTRAGSERWCGWATGCCCGSRGCSRPVSCALGMTACPTLKAKIHLAAQRKTRCSPTERATILRAGRGAGLCPKLSRSASMRQSFSSAAGWCAVCCPAWYAGGAQVGKRRVAAAGSAAIQHSSAGTLPAHFPRQPLVALIPGTGMSENSQLSLSLCSDSRAAGESNSESLHSFSAWPRAGPPNQRIFVTVNKQ